MKITQPLNVESKVEAQGDSPTHSQLILTVDGVKTAETTVMKKGKSGKYTTYWDINEKERQLLLETFPELIEKTFVAKECCHYPSGSATQTTLFNKDTLYSSVNRSAFTRAIKLGYLVL